MQGGFSAFFVVKITCFAKNLYIAIIKAVKIPVIEPNTNAGKNKLRK